MRKVVFVVPALGLGGAENSVLKAAALISSDEVAVHIIALSGPVANLSIWHSSKVECESLNASSSANPLVWFRLHRRLQELRANVVVGWSTYANFVAVAARGRRDNWKCIVSERNFPPRSFARQNTRPLRRAIVLCCMRLLYRRADVVTANSSGTLKFLRRFVGVGPGYELLPNIIDLGAVSDLSKASVSADVWPSRGPRILAVGRLYHQKGFDILLRALSIVRARHNWELVIVGDGPERGVLANLAQSLGVENAVRWVGAVHNPFPYYATADIVVVPSRFEGFPNVALEAMASGKAVICSDCRTGPSELTDGGTAGVLVPVEDAAGLAQSIVRLGEDKVKRLAYGVKAIQKVRRAHDFGAAQSLYQRVLLGVPLVV